MLTANDIKTRGVKAIEEALTERDRAVITVRGKVKYVVMPVQDYDEMRSRELDAAYAEVMSEIERGEYTTSLEDHFKELDNLDK